MNTTKKLLILLLAFLTTNMAEAYDFMKDGIYYLINGSEVTVTSRTPYYNHSNDYTGDVVIPETVTYRGHTYPVTAIGDNAFYWCSELTSIHIPKSIKRIEGNMCFYACESLSFVEIESLESWCSIDFEISPGYNFSYSNPLSYTHQLYINGEMLTELVIPSSVTRIGTSAFCHLSSLSRLVIPSSVSSIGNSAFIQCGGIDRLDIPDLETWMKIDIQGSEANPMIHARKIYLDGIEMTRELVIPEKTIKISANAFNGCHRITSVSIPPSVETIGTNAFANCDSLEMVEIQDIVAWCNIDFKNAGSNPINNGYSLAWYNEQEVVVYVNGNPVTQLDIPEGVTSIGAFAFAGASFDHVTFPNTLISIGNGAFQNNRLEEVILPESLKSLGDNAFYYIQLLKKVQINADLEEIPVKAFGYCNHLSDISLPATIKKIGCQAFIGCRDLTTMPMTDSLQIIEESAFVSTGIEYLKTGKSLTSIGASAFAASNLIKVEIDSVHKIPECFCAECFDLTSVTLGSAVDTLEAYCFRSCYMLDTIISKAEVPPVMNGKEDSFFESKVFQNATLYVPSCSLEAYKTAKVWKEFQNIVGLNNDDIPGDVNGDGEISVADVNSVIDVVVMGGNGGHTRIPAADVNGDGEITIADVNAIIYIILGLK